MNESGLIPPAPEAIRGQEINIEFVSILAQAQKMQGMKPIEQGVSFVGSLVQAFPEAADALDVDETVREYCKLSGAPAKMLRDPKAVEALREQRRQAMARQEQAMEMQRRGRSCWPRRTCGLTRLFPQLLAAHRRRRNE